MEAMQWGVPLRMAGKRPGTSVLKRITNVRNLSSPFWRSMIANPKQRCLVPFTEFAEPKIGAGREEHWFPRSRRPGVGLCRNLAPDRRRRRSSPS